MHDATVWFSTKQDSLFGGAVTERVFVQSYYFLIARLQARYDVN